MPIARKKRRESTEGMVIENTPVEDWTKQKGYNYGLFVKREDLSCPPPGPPFSKARGVFAHLLKRPEKIIGVLDTRHSQAGHAVARACQILNKKCINYYPEFKYEPGHREPQEKAKSLGAKLHGLKAGRSAILFHQARKHCESMQGYMMPNALKLEESIEETAKEVKNCAEYKFKTVLIPASSATIAAGVILGFNQIKQSPVFVIHLGYSRSEDEVRRYIGKYASYDPDKLIVIDEGYKYKDKSRPGETPNWPCNEYYDLKTFRWWLEQLKNNRKSLRPKYKSPVLFWNIG